MRELPPIMADDGVTDNSHAIRWYWERGLPLPKPVGTGTFGVHSPIYLNGPGVLKSDGWHPTAAQAAG